MAAIYLIIKLINRLFCQLLYVLMIVYCVFSIKSNAELLLGMHNIHPLENSNIIYNNQEIPITGPWSLLTQICILENNSSITEITLTFNNTNSHCSFIDDDIIADRLYNIENNANTMDIHIIEDYKSIVRLYNAIVVFLIILLIITCLSSIFRIYDYVWEYVDNRKYYAIANFIDMILYHATKFIMLIIFMAYLHKNYNFIQEFHTTVNDDPPLFVKELFNNEFIILAFVLLLNAITSITELIQRFAKHTWNYRNPRAGYDIIMDALNTGE